jgi:lysine-ketoglutarate reductase/saccharopine dehydrogenase-like protein (TIGR00300 family)
VIRELAREFERTRAAKGKIVVVAGPAIVRTDAGEHLQKLIEWGYVDRLFAGNAFAVYDVERALFGTSSGIHPERAITRGVHENQMRAINIIRGAGGIAAAVEKKILTRGIMHDCVRRKVDIVLTGSIRDEGPIPGVTTDVIEAQKIMRDKIADVALVLLMGTVPHSVAIANMLPSTVRTVCVDIDPSAVAKVIDRQPFQSLGLVTDVELFLRELTSSLEKTRSSAAKKGREN